MTSLNHPSKEAVTLLEFRYGDPSNYQWKLYTDNLDNLPSPIKGVPYVSVPSLEVDLPAITGTLKEKPAKITMPADSFLLALSSGNRHSPVECWIKEQTKTVAGSGAEQIIGTLYTGRVSITQKNYRGRPGSTRIEVLNWKGRLDFPINQTATTDTCNNPFLRGKCALGLVRASFQETAQIVSVSGKVLTVTDAAVSGKPNLWWRNGTVEIAGLSLRIRDYKESEPSKIYLTSDAPSDWAGQDAVFTAGCDKIYESDCTKHGNTQYFVGPGKGTPPYYPPLETGRSG